MRKQFLLCGLLTLMFFAFRTIDAICFINPKTGYYDGGSTVLRVVMAALLVALVVLLNRRFKPCISTGSEKEKSSPAFLFFSLAGVFAFVASLQGFFESAKYVVLAGKLVSGICCILGVLAALWFFVTGFWYLRDSEKYTGGAYLSTTVILWYCFRALTEFVTAPINANNSVIIAAVAVELVLALFFLAFGRYLSLEDKQKNKAKTVALSFVVLFVVAGVGAPTIISLVRAGDRREATLILADLLGALGGFFASSKFILKERKDYDEQSKAH